MGRYVSFDNEFLKEVNRRIDSGEPLIIFDLETTGFNKTTDRILTLSAIKAVYENGVFDLDDRIDVMLNPNMHIPESASNVNGIYDSDVANCPTEEEAFHRIKEFFGESPFVGGYNSLSFDQKFMENMYIRQACEFKPSIHLDVYKLAKQVFPGQKSYKLSAIAHELGCDGDLTFHHSMDDVIATFRVLNMLRKEEPVKQNTLPILQIVSAAYWKGPSHRLERIYIKNKSYISCYYDIFKKEWFVDGKYNLEQIRNDTFRLLKVENEAELVKKLRP